MYLYIKYSKEPLRGKTDLETYRKGTKYCIHEVTVKQYLSDLLNNHPRSKSRYFAGIDFENFDKKLINLYVVGIRNVKECKLNSEFASF